MYVCLANVRDALDRRTNFLANPTSLTDPNIRVHCDEHVDLCHHVIVVRHHTSHLHPRNWSHCSADILLNLGVRPQGGGDGANLVPTGVQRDQDVGHHGHVAQQMPPRTLCHLVRGGGGDAGVGVYLDVYQGVAAHGAGPQLAVALHPLHLVQQRAQLGHHGGVGSVGEGLDTVPPALQAGEGEHGRHHQARQRVQHRQTHGGPHNAPHRHKTRQGIAPVVPGIGNEHLAVQLLSHPGRHPVQQLLGDDGNQSRHQCNFPRHARKALHCCCCCCCGRGCCRPSD
mmetsp:Transcript_5961/g.9024  ORF Transcript_5961/g.9024 Transcript_5961/m.9024 type:complete len:284 (-) Transcript_5961:412-1263(-)